MKDEDIINLFINRSENAISETNTKYGHFCNKIALNILNNKSDAEECVNDTYLKVWNSIPPIVPVTLIAYIGRIVKNISINRYRSNTTQKRGNGEIDLVLDELYECLPSQYNVEEQSEKTYVTQSIYRFLELIDEDNALVFVRRYWYNDSIKNIANIFCMSESKVKNVLYRIRKKLKKHLEEDGIVV